MDKKTEYKPTTFPDEEGASHSQFRLDPKQPVENFDIVAMKILLELKNNGPFEGLRYLSDPTKTFSAAYGTKFNRENQVIRKAIIFTTTSGGKGSSWKLDDISLQHMLATGDKYGLEGKNQTKGTYHAHALDPLINFMIGEGLLKLNEFQFQETTDK